MQNGTFSQPLVLDVSHRQDKVKRVLFYFLRYIRAQRHDDYAELLEAKKDVPDLDASLNALPPPRPVIHKPSAASGTQSKNSPEQSVDRVDPIQEAIGLFKKYIHFTYPNNTDKEVDDALKYIFVGDGVESIWDKIDRHFNEASSIEDVDVFFYNLLSLYNIKNMKKIFLSPLKSSDESPDRKQAKRDLFFRFLRGDAGQEVHLPGSQAHLPSPPPRLLALRPGGERNT